MPGSADGAGTAGRFRVCLAGDDTKYIDLYKDAFGQAWFRNSENSKIIFTISGSNCFAINTSIDTGTADASQGSFGFWTCKSFFMGAAGASSDITVGRKGATILRLTAGAETDASTFLMASGTGSAPSAYTNSSDTAGKDCIFRTQSGGAHSAANPRGGNFAIHLGSKGAGGSGNNGEFLVYSPANSLNLLGCRSDRINRQDFWQYVTPSSGFTADATPTTINSLTLSDNYVYHIRVRVLGIRTDGTVRESHEFLLTAYRNGGGASIQDTTTVHAPAAPTWTVACATSGNDVQVNVTGTAHNINWFSEINYAQLSE